MANEFEYVLKNLLLYGKPDIILPKYPLVLAFGNHRNIALQVATIKPCIPVDINTHKKYQ